MRVRYHHDELGTNFKPTDLAAALGLAQLGRLDERTEQRRRNAAYLTEHLADYLTPGVPDGREHVWHQYVDALPGGAPAASSTGSRSAGSGTLIYYPVPIHRQAYLQAYLPGAADLRPAGHEPPLGRGARRFPVHPQALRRADLEAIVGRDPRPSADAAGPVDERGRRRSASAWPAWARWAETTCASSSATRDDACSSRSATRTPRCSPPRPTETGAAGLDATRWRWSHEAELDALVIAAPTTAHVPLALAAIERGLPVLVEKPLAATPAEALADRARPGRPGASRSRSATSSATTRPSSSSGRSAGRPLADHRLLDHQPARRAPSRPASATSA